MANDNDNENDNFRLAHGADIRRMVIINYQLSINSVFLSHDSAIKASFMVLAAPSVVNFKALHRF